MRPLALGMLAARAWHHAKTSGATAMTCRLVFQFEFQQWVERRYSLKTPE